MPTELAVNTTKPAKTMQEPHVVAMRQATLKAEQPTEEEIEIAQVFIAPPPNEVTQVAAKLPTTASPLPLVGLIGLLSLVGAGLLRRASAS
jgi:hypothetical protein